MKISFPPPFQNFQLMPMVKHDRRRLADKLMELANIGMGVLVFNQVVENENINLFALFLGFFLLTISYAIAIVIVDRSL